MISVAFIKGDMSPLKCAQLEVLLRVKHSFITKKGYQGGQNYNQFFGVLALNPRRNKILPRVNLSSRFQTRYTIRQAWATPGASWKFELSV